MRSDSVKKGMERAPHRALLRATGLGDEDFGKPFIGVVNSHSTVVPGHCHLDRAGAIVAEAVREAGGVPFVFHTIAICDGVAMGHEGMKFSLPSRDLIADCVESMVRAHCFDGIVCLPNCDKIIPGMLIGAMRVNVPAIFASGGPMAAGKLPGGGAVDLISVFEGIGKRSVGEIDDQKLAQLECEACPGPGSCSGMFTANSMNCLCEALGIALPGNGTALAMSPEREAIWRAAGRRIVDLVREEIAPRDIVTRASFDNAFVLDMAMGGSTNTVLHGLAVAHAADIPYDLARINELSGRTPNICKVSPSSPYHVEDVHRAGGIGAILKEISAIEGLLDLDAKTVGGMRLGDVIATARVADPACIRPLDRAYAKTGGLAILYGNLAPEGAVIKTAGVDRTMLKHKGPAVIFESQEDACAGILGGKVKPGDVVVIRYEGPRGGPGMQEMLSPTSYIRGMGLGDKCALITDGRFSGGTAGACIGHIAPEAAAGGPIALLRDGDIIAIDIPRGKLDVKVTKTELRRRKKEWTPPPPRVTEGWLARYLALVGSASQGALLSAPAPVEPKRRRKAP
ncbi:MAG: dihydroxy-acid dehydratase [Planctomycetes bacterium]|nr:dihydroxy-acid dehydratase [Planctomycetota bacterium]